MEAPMSRRDDIQRLYAAAAVLPRTPVTEDDLAPLPEPIQRYLRHCGVVGRPRIQRTALRQVGFIRQKPDAAWMPMRAEQVFTANPPGFHWYGRAYAGPLPVMSAHDSYVEGRGRMHIKLAAFIDIADATGPNMDHGSMLRYLGEICWFPTAWLSDYLTWEARDARSAAVTMAWGGQTASAVLYIADDGRLASFEAQRYYDKDVPPRLRPWRAVVAACGCRDGLCIPVEGEIVWEMDTGDFPYFRYRISGIQYEPPGIDIPRFAETAIIEADEELRIAP